MKKRLLSLLLIVALTASLAVGASAASFTDLKGHWAETYINKLAELGYITGYSDNTVKPDKDITAVEALALLSRFYRVNEDIANWIHEDYGAFVAANVTSGLKWAYDEIELCLAAGIVSENEVKKLNMSGPIEKELLSVLLVRAMQLTDAASGLSGTALTFADVADINSGYAGHIAVLVEAKVIAGDNNNKFNPRSNVNRAVLSKMIVCGLDYLTAQGLTLTLTDYQSYSNTSGKVIAATGNTVTIRDHAGVLRRYTADSATSVTENGRTGALSSKLAGCYATVRVENGKVVTIALDNTEGDTWAQGVITSFSPSGTGYSFYAASLDDSKSERYSGLDTMKVYRKGVSVTPSTIAKNEFATMRIRGGAITELYLDNPSYTVSGTIETLTLGATVTFNITEADGALRLYPLDISALPTIQRGSNPLTIERLRVGDEVTLTVKDGKVVTIITASKAEVLEGTLTTVTTNTDGTAWVLTDSVGEIHALTLDSVVAAYQGGKTIDVGIIQVGDTVSVECYGNTIIAVTLKSTQANTATKLTGKVLAVDTKSRIITVLTEKDKLIYITTEKLSSILDTTTNRTIYLYNIEANDQIVAYGAYTNASTFAATSAVIEG